jgi:hypothetical protein
MWSQAGHSSNVAGVCPRHTMPFIDTDISDATTGPSRIHKNATWMKLAQDCVYADFDIGVEH